jgi:hypothetical protein
MDRQFARLKTAKPKINLPSDPVDFASILGIELYEWQKKSLLSKSKRLIFNNSRQAGKSTVASIHADRRAIYKDNQTILLISPTLRQSGELFKKCRDWFRKLPNPPPLIEDNKLSCVLENGSRIISLPGTEGNIRTYAADLIIEDEAARVDDSLYYSVRPMLAVSHGDYILMSTPFGKRGHFYETWENSDEWEKIEVPATEIPTITPEFLDSERKALGDWWFQQEYMCKFQDAIGSLFSFDDIQAAFKDEIQPLFGAVEDTAVKPLFEGAF